MDYPSEAPTPEAVITINPGSDNIQLQFNKTFTLIAGDTVNLNIKGFTIIPEQHYTMLLEYYNWSEAVEREWGGAPIYDEYDFIADDVLYIGAPSKQSATRRIFSRLKNSIRALTSGS